MEAPVTDEKLDPLFERLLETLETALDLASRTDRSARLAEIAVLCATASSLAAKALARD